MKNDQHLVSIKWADYELLDSGDNMKLERFGDILIARPETQALWKKQRPELWKDIHAEFGIDDKKGAWNLKKSVPESWPLTWNDAKFLARLTGFKHTGIFPEQAPNWEWLSDRMKDLGGHSSDEGPPRSFIPHVLNLFGYTGIASVVAAQSGLRLAGAGSGLAEAGAFVTHVDASKQSLDWAHENARLSGIGDDKIRWILDDALAFVKREVRRGAMYDGIILDPPAFGRGAKGEVWKIEEGLQALLESLKKILSDKPGSFFLLNGYAAGYAPRAFAQAVESAFDDVSGEAGLRHAGAGSGLAEAGELHIKESSSERVIPAGIYVRFVR